MKKKEGIYTHNRLIQINLHCGSDDTVTGIALLQPPLLFKIDKVHKNCIVVDQLHSGSTKVQIGLETETAARDQLDYIYRIMDSPDNWKGFEEGDDAAPFTLDLVYDDRELQLKRAEYKAKEFALWDACGCNKEEGCRKCLKRNKWYNRVIDWFKTLGQALYDVGMAGACNKIRVQKPDGTYTYETGRPQ